MEECVWREDGDMWETDCGHGFVVNDGTPTENEMKFCCFCGNVIKEFKEEEQEC